MGISKVTRNFQVTLPKDVREIKGIKVGDDILFVVERERIDIMKMDKNIVRETAGLWSDTKETGLEFERRLRSSWRKIG